MDDAREFEHRFKTAVEKTLTRAPTHTTVSRNGTIFSKH